MLVGKHAIEKFQKIFDYSLQTTYRALRIKRFKICIVNIATW